MTTRPQQENKRLTDSSITSAIPLTKNNKPTATVPSSESQTRTVSDANDQREASDLGRIFITPRLRQFPTGIISTIAHLLVEQSALRDHCILVAFLNRKGGGLDLNGGSYSDSTLEAHGALSSSSRDGQFAETNRQIDIGGREAGGVPHKPVQNAHRLTSISFINCSLIKSSDFPKASSDIAPSDVMNLDQMTIDKLRLAVTAAQ
ncbi:hypothetical protein BCR42DRAFT_395251 [Absidia repens]|uniref:Uncharacterized protein n=1 Tax=Absidia repens TaxID=90262 RepID=A0A1X2I8J3_9FUNG|nr:hypothetical protein BCR42DRAFT_395251 [Absidia repens]